MRICLLACLALLSQPALASRHIAAGDRGRDVAVATAQGEVLVFAEPGALRGRRAFGAGILSLAIAPAAPELAVLCRTDTATTLTLWNYSTDTVREVPAEVAADALAAAYADGGHALFVLDGKSQVLVVGLDDLAVRRSLPTAPLADDVAGLSLAVSPRDWYVGLASRGAAQMGKTDAPALEPLNLAAGAEFAPRVVFDARCRFAVVGGDAAMYVVPTGDGPVRTLPLLGTRPSPTFDLGSDGQFAYLAAGNKLHAVRLDTGLIHLSGTVRAGEVKPLGVAVLKAWGAVVIAYDDGVVSWYRPLARELAAEYPPRPEAGLPALPGLPAGDAAERLGAVEALFGEVQAFQTAEPLSVAVLSSEFQRLGDLETLAKSNGWPSLVLACLATAAAQADRVPAPFAGAGALLAQVDRIELPGVTLIPELTPASLERRLGPRQATALQRQLADGRSYPVARIGPFLLPVDGEAFPAGAAVSLTAGSIGAWLSAPAATPVE